MQRMGVQIPAASVSVKNVAAVFVTASLPPFARPGTQIDLTVSSIGDATNLEGGTLLLCALHGADGQVYAEAQGPLTLGGYGASRNGSSKQVNHPTTARIPNGGLVERDTAIDLNKLPRLSILLRDPDFATTRAMAAAINQELGSALAIAVDSRRVELQRNPSQSAPELLARVLGVRVATVTRAKVVVNERTGTVVMGRDVRLGAVSILHGNLTIEITTEYQVSQPNPFSKTGETTVVPQTSIDAKDERAARIELTEGASVEQLVNGLQSMGATARDVVSILQAIKAAGALRAELEVI
jgi:flagellar P-ring protein FlgI